MSTPGHRKQSREELHLALPWAGDGALGHLSLAAGELRAFLHGLGVGQRAAYRAEVVLEELVTNVIKYGLPDPGPEKEPGRDPACGESGESGAGDSPDQVLVRCRMELAELVLVVEDTGPPFDPTAQETRAPDPGDGLESIEPGGLGLHMVRALCASLVYERRGGSNRTRACIRLDD